MATLNYRKKQPLTFNPEEYDVMLHTDDDAIIIAIDADDIFHKKNLPSNYDLRVRKKKKPRVITPSILKKRTKKVRRKTKTNKK